MIPGNGKFATSNRSPDLFACRDGVRLYSAFGITVEGDTGWSLRSWMSITTIIVDDEKPARDELVFLLKGFPEINVIGQGKNGVEAMTLIKEHAPDLVFLDVQMPGLDGFGVLKKLVERKMKVPHVVFATAFDHYAVQAFDVNALDYVLKPFDKARISKAIQRARKEIEAHTSPTERLEQLVLQLGTGNKGSAPPAKLRG